MELKCPYCKSNLIEGYIDGKHGLRWFKNSNFIESFIMFSGELLCDCIKIKCYRCKNCNKIIIDINENI